MVDPHTIVLGGGLSKMPGVLDHLDTELQKISWENFPVPEMRLSEHGETAAALGAAYAAWMSGREDG